MKTVLIRVALATSILTFCLLGTARAQDDEFVELPLQPAAIPRGVPGVHLMTPAPDRAPGNAALPLLRLPHNQLGWFNSEWVKLEDYIGRDYTDPELQDFEFEYFAREIISAGQLSHADWGYPLTSRHPHDILLPDIQEIQYLVGHGMTVWVKQQLAKGNLDEALKGIQAQFNSAGHLAATPIYVCRFVAIAVANQALDNMQLVIQHPNNKENYYLAYGRLPSSLADELAVAQWEIHLRNRTLTQLTEPWPPRGSEQWTQIALEYAELEMNLWDSDEPTEAELEQRVQKQDQFASRYLASEHSWTEEELKEATRDERIIRWKILQTRWFDAQAERISVMSPADGLRLYRELEAKSDALEIEADLQGDTHFSLCRAAMNSFQFHRRVLLHQTVESIRDYLAKHDSQFPESLNQLDWPVPNDPYTNKPFVYQKSGDVAWLSTPELSASIGWSMKFRLTVAK